MDHHQPIHCIVPPHILNEIIARGTIGQKQLAIETLKMSDGIIGQRNALKDVKGTVALFAAADGKERVIYDAQFDTDLPGIVVRKEGAPPSADVSVNEAYEGSGATYDLFKDIYGRNSIDGNGMRLDSTVHFKKGYDNAFWDGLQMVYGDGDENLPVEERLFNRFTIALDVIGHELTHGVTQFESKLVYANQPGALNESMSDIFGSLVKQRRLNQTVHEADWLIGAGLLTKNVNGSGIRSMKAPGTAYNDPVLGKDPQPAHMKDYVNTLDDSGGVHINSGIPNYAFHLAAMDIGGHAWGKAGQIWYVTLCDKLGANSTFQDCANMTYLTAAELYGKGSLEQMSVKMGWGAVGISADDTPPPPPQTGGGCLEALLRLIGAAPSR